MEPPEALKKRLLRKTKLQLVDEIASMLGRVGAVVGWVVLGGILFPALADDAKKDNIRFEYAFDIGGEPSFAIIQDRDGFLWFSSFFNGLVRYDGTAVKYFREGPDSVSSDFITQLLEDSDGYIWVTTCTTALPPPVRW